MSDDITFNLPDGFEDSGYSTGDKVVVIWDMQDDIPLVESITAVE